MNYRRPSRDLVLALNSVTAVVLVLVLAGVGCDTLWLALTPIPNCTDPVICSLLAPAPTLPVGFYDYYGSPKSPGEAQSLVVAAGLDPTVPSNFARIGLIQISEQLISDGRDRFFNQLLGDPASIGQIFAETNQFFALNPNNLAPVNPADDPSGVLAFRRQALLTILLRPRLAETNLKVRPDRDLRLGSSVFPAGSEVSTGMDIAAGETIPVGAQNGGVSCASCHASVDPATGRTVIGRANFDLNIGLFLALSSNTTSSFLRFNKSQIDPFDPRFPPTGRRIIDSQGHTVQLPDPAALEAAVDDIVLAIPPGGFDAAADATTAVSKIPDCFVFGEGGMGWDGGFQIGPFGGVAALTSAVHAFEINFLSPATVSRLVADLDPEVYLGLVLQNAGDPALRLPDDVRPSEWLQQQFPNAERGVLLDLPGYPAPSLFSLNGLVFSPPNETFMYSALALSAFQQSLTVPPNTSLENQVNLHSGAVLRGAEVFRAANCISCHPPPYFTNGSIIPYSEIRTSPKRAKNRRIYEGRLVEAIVPSFDQSVPLAPNPSLIALPPAPGTSSNLLLPPGLDNPDGGYKVTGLLGTYFKAPYLHDGSIASTAEAIRVSPDGSYAVLDRSGIGIPGTSKAGKAIHAGNSLRLLLDHDLRQILLENNASDPTLVTNGVEGVGHEFYVDPANGFSYQQQMDLIAFLLALDDNPGG
ncbi:MAG TPA: hypothetical protein VMV94_11000 [Phycisphaerae bacterium]|nr:hypothetical protein [Phycisphaerae bacterium]